MVASQANHRRLLLILVFALVSGAFSLGGGSTAGAQTKPKLSLADILTGLKSTKATLAERNQLLTEAAGNRGVTFSLTPEIERELRATGASNALIAAIRQNGPVVTSTPRPTPVANTGGTAQAYHTRADDLFNKFDFASAIPEYTRTLQLEPSRSLAYVRRGFAYNYLGDSVRAFDDFESAFKADPRLKNEEYMLCIYYKKGDDPNYIVTKCTETLNKYKGFSLAHYKRGIAYSDLEDYERALADFSEAIRNYPNFSNAYNSRAIIYIDHKKNYSAAVSDATAAIRIRPDFDSAYYNRGLAYFSMNSYDAALTDFTRVTQLTPNDPDPFYYRGRIYYEQKNFAQALSNFTRAVSLDPKHAMSYLYRGNCYYLQKDYQTAISDFTESIRLQPLATSYRNRALAYEAIGRTDLANADRRRAQQLEQ
jgi:tetratricopeptide (TPR) repeat protein